MRDDTLKTTKAPKTTADEEMKSFPADSMNALNNLSDIADIEKAYFGMTTLLASLKRQQAMLEDSEKLFRSEVLLQVHESPEIMECKLTVQTAEAFYRAQRQHVMLGVELSKVQGYIIAVSGLLDVLKARLNRGNNA